MQVTVGSVAASFAQPSTSLAGLEEAQTGEKTRIPGMGHGVKAPRLPLVSAS